MKITDVLDMRRVPGSQLASAVMAVANEGEWGEADRVRKERAG